jgi:tetratricopeptide (TPR) repeat protein
MNDRARFFAGAALRLALSVVAFAIPDSALAQNRAPSGVEMAETLPGNFLAAREALRSKDIPSQAFYLRAALAQFPGDLELLNSAFVASLANGEFDDAFRLAEELEQRGQKTPLTEMALAARSLKERDYLQAVSRLTPFPNDPLQLATILMRVWAVAGLGNADAALELLDQINDANLALMRDHHAALISDLRGYGYEAKKRWRAVHARDVDNMRFNDAWARFLIRNGARDEARTIYLTMQKAHPHQAAIQAALQNLDSGKTPSRATEDAIAGAGEVLFEMGSLLARKDSTLSLSLLNLAIFLGVKDGAPQEVMGDVLGEARQYDAAIKAYEAVPASAPTRVYAETRIGEMLQSAERPEAALKHMQTVAFWRQDYLSYVTLADIYRAQRKWRDAVGAFTRGIELMGPPAATDWKIYFLRAAVSERANDWPAAEQDLKKALELSPDQPEALNYLGYSWVDKNINLEPALAMIQKAVAKDKENGEFIDSLGWAYFRLGRYDEALVELERAIKLKGGVPEINDHLGDAYWKVGRKREAVFQWRKTLDLKPDDDIAARVNAKLTSALKELN